MTGNEYQKLAARTIDTSKSRAELEKHALYGMCAECGEVHSIFQKQLQGHDVDDAHVIKEIGDCLWMIAELCTVRGYLMEDVMVANIEKLKERYPNGFEAEKSLRRKEGDV